MKKYTNDELQVLTSQWGHDRKITINGKIPTQTIKFGEEMAELFEAETPDDVKDAIGDMIVVISMICDLNGTAIMEINRIEELYTSRPYNQEANLVVMYGKLCKSVVREDDQLNNILANILHALDDICSEKDLDLNGCWNLAYDEIKDRTGTLLENGNFVKDEDLGN